MVLLLMLSKEELAEPVLAEVCELPAISSYPNVTGSSYQSLMEIHQMVASVERNQDEEQTTM